MLRTGRDPRVKRLFDATARAGYSVKPFRAFCVFSHLRADLCSFFRTVKSILLCRGAILAIALLLIPSSMLFVALKPNIATAAPSNYLNFQARLLTNTGNLVPDGTYNIEFKLYKSSASGASLQGVCVGGVTDDCEWLETRTSGNKVSVTNGYFSVNLASVTGFGSSIDWSSQHWLTMNIGGTGSPSWDGEMTPRILLTAVPLAFVANNVNSGNTTAASTASANTVLQSGNTTGSTSNSGTVTLQSGNVTNGNSGNISIDAGTASGTKGTVSLGVTNASSLIFGRSGLTTLNNGALTVAENLTVDTNTLFVNATTNRVGIRNSSPSVDLTIGDATSGGATIELQPASGQTAAIYLGAGGGAGRVEYDTSTSQLGFFASGSLKMYIGAGTINLGVDTTLAAGKALTITGGNTASRPGTTTCTTEGMLYYDTTTHQLLVCSATGGKWQADRSDAVIVAANNSSQADKDAADYVANGNTGTANDGDQIEINAALTAASGRKVVLLAGTYVADATILVPNDTTLTGVGRGTLVELADLDAAENLIENSDTSTGTGVIIRDMRLDGRDDLNTAGLQNGIYFSGMGDGTGGSARQGGQINNLWIEDFREAAIYLTNSDNNILSNVESTSNGTYGIRISSSDNNNITGNTSINSNYGFFIDSANGNTITGNNAEGGAADGIYIYSGSSYNTVTGNTATNNLGDGIIIGGSYNTITGNISKGNSGNGIDVVGGSYNTLSANMISGNVYGIFLNASTNNDASSNTIKGNTYGIRLETAHNSLVSNNLIQGNTSYGVWMRNTNTTTVSSNNIYDNGGSTTNKGIYFESSDSNTTVGNTITDTSCTTTCYAVDVDSSSDNNYLADNTYSGPSATYPATINDTGTGTRYASQLTPAAVLQSGSSLIKANTTSVLTGSIDPAASTTVPGVGTKFLTELQIGDRITVTGETRTVTAIASDTSLTVDVAFSNNANDTTPDRLPAALVVQTSAGTRVITVDSAGLSTFGAGLTVTTGQNFIVNGDTFSDLTGSGLTVTGNALTVDASSSTGFFRNGGNSFGVGAVLGTNDNNSLVFRTNSTTALTVSTAQVSTFSGNVVLAATKTLRVTGNVTGSRPSGSEGEMYYDTTTKQLLIYANGKWQADRSTSTKIVAASDSSQAIQDSADYVADGTADEVEINNALSSAAGGKVYLAEGTYSISAGITVPYYTTLVGAGNGTIITIPNALNPASLSMITGYNEVHISNLKIDGNRANQSSGTIYGIELSSADNSTLENVYVTSLRNTGINISGDSDNVIVSKVTSTDNAVAGITLGGAGSSNIVLSDSQIINNSGMGLDIGNSGATEISVLNNIITNNTSYGIYLIADKTIVNGNRIQSSGSYGILLGSTYNEVTDNYITSSASDGINISGDNNYVASNVLYDNAGSGSANGIYAIGNNNIISNNAITDTAGTGYAIRVSGTSNVLSGNTYSGVGAATINDTGTGTRYASQLTPAAVLQSGSSLIKANTTSVLTGSIDPAASTTVPGVGTKFLTELQIGDRITVTGETRTVTAIASDTSLTVDVAFSNNANDTTPDRLPAALRVTNSSSTNTLVVSDDGSTLFQNAVNSATAFVVKSASAAETLFSIDTANRGAGGGNLIKVGNSTGTDTATTIFQLDGATADPTTNLAALNGGLFYNSTTNKISIIENGTVKVVCNQTDASCGGNSTTLQQSYDADANGSDARIDLTSTDGSLILSNPSSGGSTSAYVLNVVQLATGAVGGLDVQSSGSGNLLRVRDTTATAADVLTVADGGATTFKNQTNSSSAFQIQNAAGGSLFNIDSTNANITLNGLNQGEPQAWTTTTALSTGREGAESGIIYNGYYYIPVGDDGSNVLASIAYSKINADGTLNTWSTTGINVPSRTLSTSVEANGYMYLLGGTSLVASTDVKNDVYYAKINADGTVGTFTSTNSLPAARKSGTAVVLKGYIYYIGGDSSTTATPSAVKTIYYAKLNADGTLGTWTAVTNSDAGTPLAQYYLRAVTSNGYIYVVGGNSTSNIYYARPDTNGNISSTFTTEATNTIPGGAGNSMPALYTANGYLYIAGGSNGSVQPTVFYSALAANGSLGTWTQQNTTNDLPAARATTSFASANGYLYAIGGWSGSGAGQTTAYYTSLPRVKLGGSLDLVGLGTGSLTDPSAGGSLTAGNTKLIGSLDVQGQATFAQGLLVNGSISTNGQVNISTSTNTATAFQVQNANNANILAVSTISATQNLITNGGFESNTAGWALTATAVLTTNSTPQSGTQALNIATSATTLSGATYQYNFKAYNTYKLSFYARASASTSAVVEYGSKINGTETACQTGITLTTSYVQYTCTINVGSVIVPGIDLIYIRKTGATTPIIYLDSVQLEYGSAATTFVDTPLANLVANPSVESNTNGWILRTNGAAPTIESNNEFSLYGNRSMELFTSTTAYNGALYNYQLAPSTRYSLSVWMRRDTSTTSTINVGYAATPYTTGTAGTAGVPSTTLTGSSTVWTAAMVGSLITFPDGQSAYITARASNTSITLSTSVTVAASTTYEITQITDCLTGQTVNTTWTQYTCTFTTSTVAKNQPGIYIVQSDIAGDYIYVDGMSLVAGGVAQPFIQPASALQVEPLNAGNLTLLGANTGDIGSWGTTTALPVAVSGAGVTYYGGYVYSIAGVTTGSTLTTTSYYAKVNSDGTLGTWNTTTALPVAIFATRAVAYNGYMYMVGGYTNFSGGSSATSTSYFAKINRDGTLGSWNTTTSFPLGTGDSWTVAYNGYLYRLVTWDGSSFNKSIYYAKLNANGTIGTWTLSGSSTAYNGYGSVDSVTIANGYLYVAGGWNGAADIDSVAYARVNSDGSIGSFTTNVNYMTEIKEDVSLHSANGYLYIVGGETATGKTTVEAGRLNSDGSINAFSKRSSLNIGRGGHGGFMANGYLYAVGGSTTSDGGAPISSVEYASTGRVSLGGSLDLVGLGGQTLGDGSGAGQLTAGNTTVIGTLDVRGNANFTSDLAVGGTLSVSGQGNFGGNLTIGAQTDATVAPTLVNSAAGNFGGNTSRTGAFSSAVYNGKLYVSTKNADTSAIYRYDDNGTWTKVSHTTLGKIIAGDTANIDQSVLTVYNGKLYAGTQTGTTTGAVYAYDGTTWTLQQATRGAFGADATDTDGVSSMAVYNGKLYITTKNANLSSVYRFDGNTTWTRLNATRGAGLAETADIDGGPLVSYGGYLWWGTVTGSTTARVYRYDGNTFTLMNTTAGTFTSGTTTVADVNSLQVFNGQLFVGTGKTDLANIYILKGGAGSVAGADIFYKSTTTDGRIDATNDATDVDAVPVMTVYNGRLYAGTQTTNLATVYEYTGISTTSTTSWTKINSARGTFGSEANTDIVDTMVAFNGSLYIGTEESTKGSIYAYTKTADNSYALQFSSSTTNPQNVGAISFVGSQEVVGNTNNTGSFIFTHGISTTGGSYDLAEDYPTRDTSLTAGDIVVLDTNERGFVAKSGTTKYDNKAVGIYSTNPALRLSQADATIDGARAVPIALAGRVPVKVTNENGAIQPGDYITTSSRPGYGMKATSYGQVIGKAMESFNDVEGTVMVFINVTQYAPSNTEVLEGSNISALVVTGTITAQRVVVEDVAISGTLTVGGDSDLQFVRVHKDLEIGGKIISVGDAPTVVIDSQLVSTPQVSYDTTATVDGTDVAGVIKLTTNTTTQADLRLKLKFNKQYTTIPNVVISALGRDSANMGIYIESIDGDYIIFNFSNMPQNAKTYQFNYQVIQSVPST